MEANQNPTPLDRSLYTMPTQEDCKRIEIDNATMKERINAIAERLDEAIEETKSLRADLKKLFMPLILLAVLGSQAIPLLKQVLGAG